MLFILPVLPEILVAGIINEDNGLPSLKICKFIISTLFHLCPWLYTKRVKQVYSSKFPISEVYLSWGINESVQRKVSIDWVYLENKSNYGVNT